MADGFFPTLISKDKDPNLVSNPVFVQLTDGSTALSVTGTSLDVNVTNTVAVSASDLDIRDLTAGVGTGEDNILIFANTVKDGSGTDYVPLVDADGHLQIDVLTMPAITINYEYAEDTGHTTGDVGAFVLAVRNDTYGALAGSDKDYIPFMTNASGGLYVDIASQTLTAVKISKDANANTETNPIFVKVVDTVVSGEEVHDWDTSVGVSTTDNHDYTVTGAVMFVKSIIVAMSGGGKFTLQTGPLATLVTKAVGFIPKHGGVTQLFFDPAIEVPVASTGTVRIIRENRESSPQDVYSTIIGNDV